MVRGFDRRVQRVAHVLYWHAWSRMRGGIPWWRKVAALFVIVVMSSGCLEAVVEVDLNGDSSGRAVVRYLIPLAFTEGNNEHIMLEKNRLLPTTRAEAEDIWGARSGVTIEDFAFRDIKSESDEGLAGVTKGLRHVEMRLTFDSIAAISTSHFYFRYFPQDGHRYFLARVKKSLKDESTENKGAFGGMGKVLGPMLKGRHLTMNVRFPDRIEDSNATEQQFAAASWKIPINTFLNQVQEEILMWAEMPSRDWDKLRSLSWNVTKWFRGEDWADAQRFPIYAVIPVDESTGMPDANTRLMEAMKSVQGDRDAAAPKANIQDQPLQSRE